MLSARGHVCQRRLPKKILHDNSSIASIPNPARTSMHLSLRESRNWRYTHNLLWTHHTELDLPDLPDWRRGVWEGDRHRGEG